MSNIVNTEMYLYIEDHKVANLKKAAILVFDNKINKIITLHFGYLLVSYAFLNIAFYKSNIVYTFKN